jgi:hypothetical protein
MMPLLPNSPNNPVEARSRRLNRCELLVAGSLLLAGVSGCSGARTTTAAANPRQETRISSRVSAPYRALDNSGEVEEYPDFRGRRAAGAGLRGPGLPPIEVPGASSDGLVEPPLFPGVDERDNGGPAA